MQDTYNKGARQMKEQLIISVGREFGSGGHEIAQKLADHYHLPLYDHNLLDEMAEKHGMDKELFMNKPSKDGVQMVCVVLNIKYVLLLHQEI